MIQVYIYYLKNFKFDVEWPFYVASVNKTTPGSRAARK